MAELTLRIITPERIPLDTTVTSVRIPASDGSMGILPRHANMVAKLDSGLLRFKDSVGEQVVFVAGGFCEVRDNTVRVVTSAGERATEIDEERARAAEQRARERLETGRMSKEEAIDVARAEMALRRAILRLSARGGR